MRFRGQRKAESKVTAYVNSRIHSATLLVYGLGMIGEVGEPLGEGAQGV